MAEKKVTVVIDGKEFVSDAADSAGGAMDGFTNKQGKWSDGLANLRAGWEMLRDGINKISGAIMDSFAAYDELQTSQRKLEGAAKLTGLSLEYLHGIAAEGRTKFGLSKVVANEYAVEMGKLEKASGGAAKATDLLSGFLNIGAARGMSAADSMTAAKQALLGIDEGTDKLFGKNPSGLWADYAIVIGKSAGKFSDMDKQAALAYAVLQGGNATIGSYASYLDSAQGKQALLNQQLRQTQADAGEAMQPLRTFATETLSALASNTTGAASALKSATQGLVDFLTALRPVAGPVFALGTVLLEVFGSGVTVTMIAIKKFAGAVAVSVGEIIQSFGWLVEKGGKFLKIFGIDVVAAAGKQMKDAGQDMVDVNKNKLLNVEQEWVAFGVRANQIVGRWKGAVVQGAEEASVAMESHGSTVTATATVVEAGTAKINAALNRHMGPTVKQMIGLTEGAIRDLGKAATAQLPPETAQKFNAHMESLAANAELVRQRITATTAPVEEASGSTKDMAQQTASIARAGLEAAHAFGVMSDASANTLNSVITMSESIARVASGDMTAIPAMIASAANLISMMVSDGGRKKLIADNTLEMERLRRELGNLSLNVTGEAFGKLQGALGEVLPKLKGGRGAANTTDIVNALSKRGLGMGDLKKLADQLGIRIYSDSGALSVDGLKALFEAMGLVELGKFGQDYASQKESVTAGFGVNKTGDLGQIGALGTLGGRFSSILQGVVDVNDLAGSRSRLAGLFAQMNAGGISPDQLGGLTGSEFLDLITNLISRIDNLTPSTGGGTAGTGTGTGGGTVTTSGGVTVPTKSLSDVLDGVTAQTVALGAYHVRHLDIATAHLDEARLQTGILMSIAKNTLPLVAGISAIADEGLEAERVALAAERGRGASY